MSEEQLKAFIAKVQTDTSLQEKLKAEDADPVAIAKAAGFAITTEDLNSHHQDLSDTELEIGTGGTAYTGLPKPTGRCTVQVASTCLGGEPC